MSEEKTKNNPNKKCGWFAYSIFLLNLALVAVFALLMKQGDDKKEVADSVEKDSLIIPSDEEVRAANGRIMSDRENKLRDLNTSPKELRRVDTTTTTTTTTETETPSSSSSDSTTKSS